MFSNKPPESPQAENVAGKQISDHLRRILDYQLTDVDTIVVYSKTESTVSIRAFDKKIFLMLPVFSVPAENLDAIINDYEIQTVLQLKEVIDIIIQSGEVVLVEVGFSEDDFVSVFFKNDENMALAEFSMMKDDFEKLRLKYDNEHFEMEFRIVYNDIAQKDDSGKADLPKKKLQKKKLQKKKLQKKKPAPILDESAIVLLLQKGFSNAGVTQLQGNLKSLLNLLLKQGCLPASLDMDECSLLVRDNFVRFLDEIENLDKK